MAWDYKHSEWFCNCDEQKIKHKKNRSVSYGSWTKSNADTIYYVNDFGLNNNLTQAWNDIWTVTVDNNTQTNIEIQYPQSQWQGANWPWQSLNGGLQYVTPTISNSAIPNYSYWYDAQRRTILSNISSLMPETEAERVAREADLKARAERKAAANQRAEHLLFSILTPSQVKQYKDDGFFEQHVNERLYRIRNKISGNIELIESGKAVAKYCAHPLDAYDLPVPDVMLSQLLALRANEAQFLSVANRTALV